MPDEPQDPTLPDSFAGRLDNLLKKSPGAGEPAEETFLPSPKELAESVPKTAPRLPEADSFAGRLDNLLKKSAETGESAEETPLLSPEELAESVPRKGPRLPEADSVAGRLDALAKDAEDQQKERAEAAAKEAEEALPADSFAGRLTKLLGEEEQAAEEEPWPADEETLEEEPSEEEEPEEEAPEEEAEEGEETLESGPVGTGEHVVKDGECITSLAKRTGHFWETIWTDAANIVLRETRKDPNVLLPGDRVHIPPLRRKEEPSETEQRHRFVRKGEPARLRLRFLADHKPLAGQPYTVVIGDWLFRDELDQDGSLDVPIRGNATKALVTIGTENPMEYEVLLGDVDPIDTLIGIQQRLQNLDYPPGNTDGTMDDETHAAISQFQADCGRSPTGELDAKTRRELKRVHGS